MESVSLRLYSDAYPCPCRGTLAVYIVVYDWIGQKQFFPYFLASKWTSTYTCSRLIHEQRWYAYLYSLYIANTDCLSTL